VLKNPAVPYVVPFVVFLGFLGLHSVLPLPDLTDQIVRVVVMTLVIWFVARPVLDFRVRSWLGTLLSGVVIFALWVGPDLLIPGYRKSILFQNSILGTTTTTLTAAGISSVPVLILRFVRAVAIVPIVEELFWRGWLMRWLIEPDFEKVPLGAYSTSAFWIVAVLFASEHGSYWDVGLVAGVIFNYWMVKTKSLGDLILSHAVANACLSAYVILAGKWEYWL
jgi:CAAX prenyl protease-like protein